jgi:hypothetical protein
MFYTDMTNVRQTIISHLRSPRWWRFPEQNLTCTSHDSIYPSLDQPNNIWLTVTTIVTPTVQFPPASSHLTPRRFRCVHMHPVIKHVLSVFFPQSERPKIYTFNSYAFKLLGFISSFSTASHEFLWAITVLHGFTYWCSVSNDVTWTS